MKNDPAFAVPSAFFRFMIDLISWPFRVFINACKIREAHEDCPHCAAQWSWDEYEIQNCNSCGFPEVRQPVEINVTYRSKKKVFPGIRQVAIEGV